MRAALRILLAGATLLLAACSSHKEAADVPQQANSFNIARSLNSSPASAACSMAGGNLELARQLDGTSVGMCQMSNGRRCSESGIMNGSCS